MKWIIIVLSALLLLLIIIYTQIDIHKTGTLYSYNGCVSALSANYAAATSNPASLAQWRVASQAAHRGA